MRRTSFGVVTAVVTVIAVIALVAKVAIVFVPEAAENRLAGESAEFLTQASREQIDWKILDENAFSEARKKDRPIMLVVGSACSFLGRSIDRFVFTSKDVRSYLARNFICVRADSMATPEIANAFLPITRALIRDGVRIPIPADFQIWFLTPKGELLGYAAETSSSISLDPRSFLFLLRNESDLFERSHAAPADLARVQHGDLDLAEAPLVQQVPDLPAFATALAASSLDPNGGFPVNGLQRLLPSAWRFQLLARRYYDYTASIAACLRSPAVDVLDGGFFTGTAPVAWIAPPCDKLAVANAEMLQTLAVGAVAMNDPVQRWLAVRTADSLLGEFSQGGRIAAGRIGDERENGRSARSAFSPRELRDRFPDSEERDWVRWTLGLRVETNPQMMPMLPDLAQAFRELPRLERTIEKLKAGRADPKFAGQGLLDAGGFSLARMIEACRILGDQDRLRRSLELSTSLDDFRTADDVNHSLTSNGPQVYLGDYLAYADASLQRFLALGDPQSFERGLAVLRRGMFLFAGKAEGEYTLSQPATTALAPKDSACPEIVDNLRESCTAQIVRLAHDYGRLLGKQGDDLVHKAGTAMNRFAPISAGLGQFAAGYFCASADFADSSFAIVVGPDALDLANRLAARAPTRLVAPAIDPVRRPGERPGIYIVHDLATTGPFTLDEAAKRLARNPL